MDDTSNDLFWNALNYRTAHTLDANDQWEALQACVYRLIAEEREACAKLCDTARERYDATGASVAMARALAEDIRARADQA